MQYLARYWTQSALSQVNIYTKTGRKKKHAYVKICALGPVVYMQPKPHAVHYIINNTVKILARKKTITTSLLSSG